MENLSPLLKAIDASESKTNADPLDGSLTSPANEDPEDASSKDPDGSHGKNGENGAAGSDPDVEEAKGKDIGDESPADDVPVSNHGDATTPNPVEETDSPRTLSKTNSSESPGKISSQLSPKKKRSRTRRDPYHRLFQDAITVFIPLSVTADLKSAIQRTRAKRIKSILKRFPSLKKETKKVQEEEKDDAMIEEDDDDGQKPKDAVGTKEGPAKSKQEKKKKPTIQGPQPHQYGSVLDYLEAKYVRGVMLGDEEDEGASMDDKSEGQGSVYSGGSFLDDTDLQRDVAEQVMATTTMTKLELEEDDADFFVNVGNLEVEDNEYGDHYDPLQDKEVTTTKTKKRKKSQASSAAGSPSKKPKIGEKKIDKKDDKRKSTTSSVASSKSGKSLKSTKSPKKATNTEEKKRKQKLARQAKAYSEKLYRKVVAMIKAMTEDELPRRRTKLKVALTCPPNKKAGDDITFTNPHNPGQRLRVKVPKDCFPGGTFKVTVPVKPPPPDSDKEGTDHNKFSRGFQELLDDYARAYDDWCQAQLHVDKKFAIYKEKQQKFDRFIKDFPTNLITPVDSNYLKKIVRRARQNRHKRTKTAASKPRRSNGSKDDGGSDLEDDEEDEEESPPSKGRSIHLPAQGVKFPKLKMNTSDFALEGSALSTSISGNSSAKSPQDVKSLPDSEEKKAKKVSTVKASPPPPKGRTIGIPREGTKFPTMKWKTDDFT